MEKGLLHKQIRDFFVRNFDVRQEKEDELETIESIRKGIEFKGTNLWVLIFATFVASLGLNTNSTAVIIGAMLISPLMGPIMGFGLGLEYPKKVFLNKQREKIVTRYVGVIVFFTIVPSLFLSYNLIRASYFNDRVRTFVADELSFPNTQILSKTVTDTSDKKEVKVVLIGETVPETMIANARAKMPKYGLKNVGLVVQQGFGQEATDINELKSLLMQDLYKNSEEVLRAQSLQIDSLKRDLNKYHSYNHLTSELMPEMKVLFPYIKEVSCAHTYLMDMDSIKPDTVLLVYLKSKEKVREAEQEKIKKWLAARVEQKKIKLIIE